MSGWASSFCPSSPSAKAANARAPSGLPAERVSAIADRYPGRDHGQHPDEESITEAMTGALQVLLGNDTLEGGPGADTLITFMHGFYNVLSGMIPK